ncbi:dTDP-4-dehydrorhamnose reductase family protein [Scopulibacillus cellulosilyticus]|uniref:dTDP-4-dehydrorhamnose reductase n=1 Tax=Scopulibacillus cellulosilyticus TaxID=2665665 RepID=A0ABW2Q089_9BACL
MKILVLGAKGMAGHMITSYLKSRQKYTVIASSRDPFETSGVFLDCLDDSNLESFLLKTQPNVVINCVGILNQAAEDHPYEAIKINSLLPQLLAKILDQYGGKLIHLSSDCVFSGKKGNYQETDVPDGVTMYARTKTLGEITSGKHLTIRTSIIGPELKDGIGLFHWFMKQKKEVDGYDQVFWNGVTTLELAKVIETLIQQEATGLYHLVSAERVSKYELLNKIKEIFHKDIIIHRDVTHYSDRTLVNKRTDVNYTAKSYDKMLKELKGWMLSS